MASLVWFLSSGDRATVGLAWRFFTLGVVGLVGSFALHEVAHVMVLKRISTVTLLEIDRTAWRVSIVPHGALNARQVVVVALAGPAACVGLGAILLIVDLDRALAWWYLAHGLFLLPFFGDGRSLISGIRGRGVAGG